MPKNQTVFELAPWEVAQPDVLERRRGEVEVIAPPVAPFESELVISRVCTRFAPFGSLYFRPVNSTDEGTFCLADSLMFSRAHGACGIYGHWNEPAKPNPAKIVAQAIDKGRFGRLFYLDDDANFVQPNQKSKMRWKVFLVANGWGLWVRLRLDTSEEEIILNDEAILYNAPFRWHGSRQIPRLASSSALELWQDFRPLLLDKLSEAAQARDWILQVQKLKRKPITWKVGSRAEWQRVMSLVLRSQTTLWDGPTEITASLVIARPSPHFTYVIKQKPLLQEENYQEIHSKIVARWHRVLLRHFAPYCPEPKTLYRFAPIYSINSSLTPQIIVKSPTAHEQIEALLNLRDWARQNLPPETVAELFAKPLD